jgi:hypothetical protein
VLRRAPEQVRAQLQRAHRNGFWLRSCLRRLLPAGVDDRRTTRPDPRAGGSRFAVGFSVRGHLHRRLAGRVRGLASRSAARSSFRIGKPRVGAAGVVGQVLDEQAGSQTVDRAFWLVRFLSLTIILLCVGGANCACVRADWGARRGTQIAVDPPRITRKRARLARGCGYRAPRRTGKRARTRRGPAPISDWRRSSTLASATHGCCVPCSRCFSCSWR